MAGRGVLPDSTPIKVTSLYGIRLAVLPEDNQVILIKGSQMMSVYQLERSRKRLCVSTV